MPRKYYFLSAAAAAFSLSAHAALPDDQQSQIAHGEYLARAGDCVACHSAPGGKPYAGGLYLNSRFGQIASPNITPDKETGIGNWTDDQFYDSFHKGLNNHGDYLYPAMPYQWFTRVTRDDVLAIKAYLFSLQPVNAPQKPNHLTFPFNIRAGIGGWNALYFKEGTFQSDSSKSPQWNRGAYLVEGLGHCAACHTPKNVAQAPIESEAYAGGVVDNWAAPNITSDQKEGIGGWSVQTIAAYLKKGSAQGKGAAIGPMAQTVHDSLAHLTDDDLTDIAVYLKTIPAKATYHENTKQSAYVHEAGAQVYLENCSSCHQPNGGGLGQNVPALAGNGAVTAKAPDDVIRAVVGGLPAQGTYAPMPGFATVLTAQEIADVSDYVRTSWGNGAPANANPDLVNTILPKTSTMMAGTHWCTKQGDTKLDRAIKDPSGGVQPALQQINETTLLPQVKKIVGDLHKTVPMAQRADIVNSLTAAYCPVVFDNRAIPAAQRGPTLDRFASIVYTELVQPRGGKGTSD
jgi:mono/diheme cytochrome c family protein